MENLRGIGLMVLAMASFAFGDLFIKFGARTLSGVEILFYTSFFGMIIFAALTRASGQPLFSPLFLHRRIMQRNGLEIIGASGMIFALSNAPLSLVTSISQSMPLVVTAGAAVFLGEKVGLRRWVAVAVGFVGVLIILRPGTQAISAGAAYAVVATLALAGRDLMTRVLPREASTIQLGTWGFAALVIGALVISVFAGGIGLPDGREALLLVAMTLGVALAYGSVTAAMRLGEVSVITPFRYTRLLFALTLAILVLGERPETTTLIGAAIILASGLYVLIRQARLSRTAKRQQVAQPER